MEAKRGRARSEREARRRLAIQEAVVRILSRRGAPALTMARVAAEAGLAKGTLYLYFRDKKQLLQSVKEISFRPMRQELLGILEGPLRPHEKLRRFAARHFGYFDEHRDFFRVLLWDRQIGESGLRRQRSLPFRAYVEHLARVFAEGSRSGEFRKLDPTKVAVMFIEADVALLGQRLMQAKPRPVEEDADMLFEVFLNGVAARRDGKAKRP